MRVVLRKSVRPHRIKNEKTGIETNLYKNQVEKFASGSFFVDLLSKTDKFRIFLKSLSHLNVKYMMEEVF